MVTKETAPRVTAKDVADLAGLSRSTVSAVLGGNASLFSSETRGRVHRAAASLNYRPSRAGRALATGVADIVLLVVPNVTTGAQLQDAVDRIALLVAPQGLTVLVQFASDDPQATLTAALDLRPFAVIDLGVFDDDSHAIIRKAGTSILPSLEPRQLAEDPVHLSGRLQALHLLRKGTRQLVTALPADNRNDPYGPARARGVTDAALFLDAPPPLEVRVPRGLSGAVEALGDVVGRHLGPLAVCCYNDDIAVAVMAACRELSLDVPDDVSIIGSDKTDMGQLMSPRLTTIETDLPGIMELFLRDFDGLGVDETTVPPSGAQTTVDLSPYITVVAGETG